MMFLSPCLPWANAVPLGLAVSPSIGVLGAFFPDWMFCGIGAILLTVGVHLGMRASGVIQRAERWAWLVAYPALLVLFALAGWLIFFTN
jgi:hypothetical protein